MKMLLRVMDYAYYRYAKFYNKYDRLEKGDLESKGYSYTAMLIVSVPIGLMVMFLGILINDKVLGNDGYTVTNAMKVLLFVMQFGVLGLIYYRYRYRLKELNARWCGHSKQKRYLGALLAILYFIFPFIFFVVAMKYITVM